MGLRIVFMGTPDFAVESLKLLVASGEQVVGVITAPDKPAGRGKKMKPSAVKQYAQSLGLKVMQPVNLKDPAFINDLKKLEADVQVVVAFRMLPEVVWKMPRKGTFNVHASLLPQYRGAAPINWALINGETETGVTTFFLQHEIDTGHILFHEKVGITDSDTAGSLHDKLMYTGAKLALKTVQAITNGNIKAVPQNTLDNKQLKAAPKIYKQDCQINWRQPATTIHNFIRGLSPYPTAFTMLKHVTGESITAKVFECRPVIEKHNLITGMVQTDNKTYIQVAVINGFIEILSLQLAGKKRLPVKEFLLGFKHIQEYVFV